MDNKSLEKMYQKYSDSPYESEIKQAKEEYFSFSGKVHQDDDLYESRMTLFFEWYIFLPGCGLPVCSDPSLSCLTAFLKGCLEKTIQRNQIIPGGLLI